MQEFEKQQTVEVHEHNNWERGTVIEIKRDSQWKVTAYRVHTRHGTGLYWPWEVRQAIVTTGVTQ